jgi:adenylate cyclase
MRGLRAESGSQIGQLGSRESLRPPAHFFVAPPGFGSLINAQLIDAETGAHLWAERFDIDTGDLFALQNAITARIGNTLGIELIRAEAARPTTDPDALDYTLRGRAAFAKGFARENYGEAISLYEHASTPAQS